MATLHIEHPVREFGMWREAFDRFADVRRQAGVRDATVRRPIDDPAYVVVDLEFASTEQATGFLEFLRSRVWSNPAASPALIGVPRTMILDTAARE